jgi:hypothetical protein
MLDTLGRPESPFPIAACNLGLGGGGLKTF